MASLCTTPALDLHGRARGGGVELVVSAQQTRSVVLEASLQRVDGGDSWQLTDGRGGGGRRGESVHEPCIASRLSPILFRERSTDLSTILSTVTARLCAAAPVPREVGAGGGSRTPSRLSGADRGLSTSPFPPPASPARLRRRRGKKALPYSCTTIW